METRSINIRWSRIETSTNGTLVTGTWTLWKMLYFWRLTLKRRSCQSEPTIFLQFLRTLGSMIIGNKTSKYRHWFNPRVNTLDPRVLTQKWVPPVPQWLTHFQEITLRLPERGTPHHVTTFTHLIFVLLHIVTESEWLSLYVVSNNDRPMTSIQITITRNRSLRFRRLIRVER